MSGSAGDANLDDADDEEPIGEWNFIREFETSIEIDLVSNICWRWPDRRCVTIYQEFYEIC
jgi:hypothetical protein